MSSKQIAVFVIEIALVLVIFTGAAVQRSSNSAFAGVASDDELAVYAILRDLAAQPASSRTFVGAPTICFSIQREGFGRRNPSPTLIRKLNTLSVTVFKPRSACGPSPSNIVFFAHSEIGAASQNWLIVDESEIAPSGLAYHVSQSDSAIVVERGQYFPGL
ncbi:MAG TPA: hypothetical protein VH835_00175 [Dongiaceae bacterium]|jgi:hypothetical protein